jgi:hypothetical protein
MFLKHPTETEIIQIITEMKDTKATGIDEIQTEHIKQSKENTAIMVCKLITNMIEKEIWPDQLKIQVLRPIYKKGCKSDKDNYRPISLLSIIDKIIEKFFANKIREFLEKYNMLSKIQYGYTKKKGTTDLLVQINDIITKALNEGKYVGLVLIDLQKAFDTFDQEILLQKCIKMGLRGKIHNLLKSYLSNRKATVKIGNGYSDLNDIRNGVPQGSVLGPLLFLIYANDMEECICNTQMFLFADDTIVISINYNYEEMIENLQTDFDMINGWLMKNELYISEDKTININITVPKMTKHAEQICIINHSEICTFMRYGIDKHLCKQTCKNIESKSFAKYLGIDIDLHWNFKQYNINLLKKLRQILPKLYKIRNILNKKNKMIVYEAWIASYLRYGIEVYGFQAEYLINRLQKLQNKIIKVLFGNGNKTTEEIFKENKILKIIQLRDFIVITKNYFINTHKNIDVNKQERLRKNALRFEIPKWNNTYGKRNKGYYIPTIFNKLPKNALTLTSLGELKKILTELLIK